MRRPDQDTGDTVEPVHESRSPAPGWFPRAMRSPKAVPGSLLLLALVVRVVVVLSTRDLPLRTDAADYDRLGHLLADGHGFGQSLVVRGGGPTAYRPPLYPLFLGAFYKLTGLGVTGARLVQAVLGVIAVGLIGVFARQLCRRRGRHLLTITPWTIRNAVTMHAFVPIATIDGTDLAGVYNDASRDAPPPFRASFIPPQVIPEFKPLFDDPEITEVELNDELRSSALSYIRANPGYTVDKIAINIYRLFDLEGRGTARRQASYVGYGTRLVDAGFFGFFTSCRSRCSV